MSTQAAVDCASLPGEIPGSSTIADSGGFDSLFDAPEEHEGIVEPESIDLTETRADNALATLRDIEDKLLSGGMDIVQGVMRAPELMEGEPPDAWVTEYGYERARRMYAAAQAGLSNVKDAPVFIKTAENVVKSIIKARSMETAVPTTLSVAILTQNNVYTYKSLELEDDEK